jgi:tetratricopeptide (TPR) repeat protein
MDIRELGKNRFFIILVVVLAIGGYFIMRSNRERLNNKLEEKRPPWLTREFAVPQMEQAGENDRRQAERLLSDADAYFSSRNYREAGSAYQRAIALYPDGGAYFEYGKYLIEMNQMTWAKEALLLAEELGHPRNQVLYELARLHSLLKEPMEGMEYLLEAVDTGFDDFDTLLEEDDFDMIRHSITTRQSFQELVNSRS